MLALAVLLLIPLAWGLVAGRLARWSITAPIAMVAAGVALTAGSDPLYRLELDTSAIEHFVEVVLAVVLFVDATEVEGGFFGKEPKITARLLLIALPLSLVLAVAFGALTFPHANFWILAVIATVVMPTDLAPVVALVRDRRIPSRLRDLLNVESGFNDGFIAPLFLFAVAAAHGTAGRVHAGPGSAHRGGAGVPHRDRGGRRGRLRRRVADHPGLRGRVDRASGPADRGPHPAVAVLPAGGGAQGQRVRGGVRGRAAVPASGEAAAP